MEKLKQISSESKITINWSEVYSLPWYWLVKDSREFLLIVVWAKQRPIGVANGDHGWGVLFKNNEAIKVVYNLLDDPYEVIDFAALRQSLDQEYQLYYDLLVEEERMKKEWDES